jgi:hypothetical protein
MMAAMVVGTPAQAAPPALNAGGASALAAKGKYTGVAIKVTGLPKKIKAPLRITKKVKKRTKTVRRVNTAGTRVRLAPGKYQLVTPSFNQNGEVYQSSAASVPFRVRAKKTAKVTAAYQRLSNGTLSVTATGLPIGALARIRIVGNGVDETAEGITVTRELKAGQYQVEPQTVDVQGSPATPTTGPQTVTVAGGRPTSLTVGYQYSPPGGGVDPGKAAPGRVPQIQADPGQNSVKLTWTKAVAPAAAPVRSHRITIWTNDVKVDTKTTGADLSYTVKDVTGGQRYRFAVAAGNVNGYGEESPVSLEVIPILMEYKAGVTVVDPLSTLLVEGDSDSGGRVTTTGSAPEANSDFVIEPSALVPGGLTGRVRDVRTDDDGHFVVTFSPISSLDAIIEDYKIDVRNVAPTTTQPQQALSAGQYLKHIRSAQGQSVLEFGCESGGTLEPVEWTADIDVDLKADWDAEYFKVLFQGNLGATLDFAKTPGLTWYCSITIPAGFFFIGSVMIDQEIEISASIGVPSLNVPSADVGVDLALQAGFEKAGDEVTNLSDVSATPRANLFGDGTEQPGDAQASASLKGRYSGKFLGLAGLSLAAGPSMTATLHMFPSATCYDAHLGYDIGASIELGKWGVEWSLDLFNATVYDVELVNSCDRVWTGPVDVLWETESQTVSCPWSYVCDFYPPPSTILETTKYTDDYRLDLSPRHPTARSEPGAGYSSGSATGSGTRLVDMKRTDYVNGNEVTYPWCSATVTSAASDVQRQNVVNLSPIERIGPGRMKWSVYVGGVFGFPNVDGGETGTITATRNLTYQHPDYPTYEGCGQSGPEGPASWSAPYHPYSQQPNVEIIDTDPDPRRLVGTYSWQSGPKKAEVEVNLTLEDRVEP